MEITFKKPSLEVGFKTQKIYPALEPLTVTPSQEKQVFNHPNSYGYDEVIVNEVEGEKLNINPSMEEQNFSGIYNEITVNPIECEEINITPSEEEQVKEGLFNKVTVEGVENFGGISDEAFEGETVKLTDTVENTCVWDFGLKGKTIQSNTTPSPENPSEIQNVEGNVDVSITAKNKLKLTVGEYKFRGVTIKIEEDGLITLNGTVSANYPTIKLTNGLEGLIALDYVHTSDWINEDVGIVGDFTLEKYIIGGNATTTYPAVSMFNQDAERIAITGKTTTLNSFTTNSNLACLVLYLGDNTITYNNFQFYLMIEEGIKTEISDYEVYKGEAITFPLSSGQKLYEGSYLADDGIHNVREENVLNGTEKWTKIWNEGTNTIAFYINQWNKAKAESDNLVRVLSNMFIGAARNVPENNYDNDVEQIIIGGETTNMYVAIRINKSRLLTSDVNGFKAWLASNNISIEYNVAEKIIPYTSAQQEAWNKLKSLRTYKDITYITTTNTVKPILSGKYYIKTSEAKITNAQNLFSQGVRLDYLYELLDLCENISNANSMFNACNMLTELDLSGLDTSNVESMQSMFYGCTELENLILGDFDTRNVIRFNTFMYNCAKVKTLPMLDLSSAISITNIVMYCSGLTDLGGFKDLGKAYVQNSNNYSAYKLDLSQCKNLTHQSLMNVINNLYDLNLTYDVANGGTLYTQSLVLGSQNIAKLTAEGIAIATNKGWTVS